MDYKLICLTVLAALSASINAQDPGYSTITPVSGVADEPKDDVNLRCDTTGEQFNGASLKWYFEHSEVENTEDKYELRSENNTHTLKVKGVDYLTDLGDYSCNFTLTDGSKQSQVVSLNAKAYVNKFDTSKNLVQGDTLTLRCDAYGYPNPSAVWYKDEDMIMVDERTSFDAHNDIANGTLKIRDVDYPDAGDYVCSAVNQFGTHNSTIIIRVKDKLAALWPFLGICAEVLILCLIIFIYEKRRAKKMREEDAKEEADHLTNSHANRDDVRQRKV